MQELIIGETEKIFSTAIKRFAKERKWDEEDVSLLLYLTGGDEPEAAYKLCHQFNPVEEITIKNILNVKFVDFKGYSVIVPPYISGFLTNFRNELSSDNVDVTVSLNRENDEKVDMFLFKDGRVVRKIDLKDLIR